MFNKKALIALSVISGLLLATFSACSKKATEPETIKIGAILPLTGPIAFFGEYERNAIDIAVAEKNEKGGINGKQIQVVYEDSKNDAKEAVSIMNKLVSIDKIPVIFTQMSGVSMALAPVADKNEVTIVSLAMHPDFARSSKFAFRVYESITQESTELAKFIFKKGYKNLAIVHIDDVWGKEAKDSFEKQYTSMGGKLNVVETYSDKEKDYKGIIAKLKKSRIDSLFLAGYGPSVGIFAKQLSEAGLSCQLFGNIGMSWDYVLKIGGPALNGAIVVMPNFLAKEQSALPFVSKYQAKYNNMPNFESAYSYDAFNIIFQAIEKGGYTGIGTQKAMSEIKEFDGVTGKLLFDADGATSMASVSFRKIQNMELTQVE